jgi:hypothetical protein
MESLQGDGWSVMDVSVIHVLLVMNCSLESGRKKAPEENLWGWTGVRLAGVKLRVLRAVLGGQGMLPNRK